MRATAEPTVPRPARPTFSGSTMTNPVSSAAGRERHDVVQNLVGRVEEAAHAAGALADALLVLDERDAHIALAVLAEADARCHRHLRLLDQELGELHRAAGSEALRHRRPGEHGR